MKLNIPHLIKTEFHKKLEPDTPMRKIIHFKRLSASTLCVTNELFAEEMSLRRSHFDLLGANYRCARIHMRVFSVHLWR